MNILCIHKKYKINTLLLYISTHNKNKNIKYQYIKSYFSS